jgi:hypothetical protein
VTGGSVIGTELVVALGVLWAYSAQVAFLLAVLMIAVVTGAAALALRKGRQPLCNCFGGRRSTYSPARTLSGRSRGCSGRAAC